MQMKFVLTYKGAEEIANVATAVGIIGVKGPASNADRAMQEGVRASGSIRAAEREGPVMCHPSNAVAVAERAQGNVGMRWSVMVTVVLIPPSS